MKKTLTAKNVIIATGSNPRALPGADFDEKLVLSNTGALALPEVPKRLGVIGAGIIGLEMGSVWRRLGSDVTILEALPAFLGVADEAIAREAAKIFARQGLKIETGVAISKVSTGKNAVKIEYKASDGTAKTLDVDRLIVSIGRVANTAGLNAEGVGLKMERGTIVADGDCRTSVPNVWADRRRRARADAGAQGRGRGRGGRGAHRRPEAARQLQHHPLGDLHRPGNRLGRADRAAAEGRRRGVQDGSFPFSANARARALGDTAGWSNSSPMRPPTTSSACTSSDRWRAS